MGVNIAVSVYIEKILHGGVNGGTSLHFLDSVLLIAI